MFGDQDRNVGEDTGKAPKRWREKEPARDASEATGFSTLFDLCLRRVLINLDQLHPEELSYVISSNLGSEATQKLLVKLLNRLSGSELKETEQVSRLKEIANAELFKLFEHLVFGHKAEYASESFYPQNSVQFQRIVALLKAICTFHKSLDDSCVAKMLISLVIYRVENAQLGGMTVPIGTMFLNSLSNDELGRLSKLIERVVSMLKPDIKRGLEAFATTIRVLIQGRLRDSDIRRSNLLY